MGVRVEYEIRELPQSYVTVHTEYAFEQDGNQKDSRGNFRNIRVEKKVEKRGGWLLLVRGKPGHSIRLESKEQAEALGVSLQARLVNTETGEVCDKRGIPLSVVSVIGEGDGGDRVETDVDVSANDEQLALDLTDPAEAAVGDVIKGLE